MSREFNEKGGKDANQALKDLKVYFSSKNAISDIRNNLSFHYKPDHNPTPKPCACFSNCNQSLQNDA